MTRVSLYSQKNNHCNYSFHTIIMQVISSHHPGCLWRAFRIGSKLLQSSHYGCFNTLRSPLSLPQVNTPSCTSNPIRKSVLRSFILTDKNLSQPRRIFLSEILYIRQMKFQTLAKWSMGQGSGEPLSLFLYKLPSLFPRLQWITKHWLLHCIEWHTLMNTNSFQCFLTTYRINLTDCIIMRSATQQQQRC